MPHVATILHFNSCCKSLSFECKSLFNNLYRSLRTKKEEEGTSNHEDLSLILPGVGIIRQDRKNEPKADSSKGARRPMVKPQRLSDGSNSADVNSQIRANFTLDGRSVGPR